jgi:hypothetical protein
VVGPSACREDREQRFQGASRSTLQRLRGELGFALEGKATALQKGQESGVVLVGLVAKGLGKRVLGDVLGSLLGVRPSAVAGVDRFRDQQQGPDPVACFPEVLLLWIPGAEAIAVLLLVVMPEKPITTGGCIGVSCWAVASRNATRIVISRM